MVAYGRSRQPGLIDPAAVSDPFAPFNQEFSGSGSSLPSGWSWLNQGSATYSEGSGVGTVALAAGSSGVNWRGIVTTPPSASTFTVVAKRLATFGGSGDRGSGLILRDSVSDKCLTWYYYSTGASNEQHVVTWTATLGGTPTIRSSNISAGSQHQFLRIVKNSASSWDFARSTDGVSWTTQLSAFDVGAVFTPDQIGFVAYSASAAGSFSNAADYIRFS